MKNSLVGMFLAVTMIYAASGCTENQRAREWGGSARIELPKCEKLVNVTWKEGNDLWYLTRPFRSDEKPETYIFHEESSLGMMNGTVNIVETCPKQ